MNIGDTIQEISQLTDLNNHSEAAVMGATLIASVLAEDDDDERRSKAISVQTTLLDIASKHETTGFLSNDLYTKRYMVLKEMWKLAEEVFDPADAKAFYNAY